VVMSGDLDLPELRDADPQSTACVSHTTTHKDTTSRSDVGLLCKCHG
jgi:hypothetical protein